VFGEFVHARPNCYDRHLALPDDDNGADV